MIKSCLCSIDLDKKTILAKTNSFDGILPQIMESNLIRKGYFGIKVFNPKTPPPLIELQEKKIIKIIHERKLRFSYSPKISQDNLKISYLDYPFLQAADKSTAKAYNKYIKRQYIAPVAIKMVDQQAKSYGIKALEDIPKNILIC